MASRNLRKIVRWGLSKDGFTDDFDPNKYRKNWHKFQKYVDQKERSMIFNGLFRPLFQATFQEEVRKYRQEYGTLPNSLKKEMRKYVKEQVEKTIKAQLAAKVTTEQGYKESQSVLAEG